MKKRITALLLALGLAVSVLAGTVHARGHQVTPGLNNFVKTQEYKGIQFADVHPGQWYADSVKQAYELGLVNGRGDGLFHPLGWLSAAETVALAARIHSIYYTGTAYFETDITPWYQNYLFYAQANGILNGVNFTQEDMGYAITRAGFAWIMSQTLPDEALAKIGSVTSVPDLTGIFEAFTPAVLKMYNAGILAGNEEGNFEPGRSITRCEVAAAVVRMVIESERVRPEAPPVPEGPPSSAKDRTAARKARDSAWKEADAVKEKLAAAAQAEDRRNTSRALSSLQDARTRMVRLHDSLGEASEACGTFGDLAEARQVLEQLAGTLDPPLTYDRVTSRNRSEYREAAEKAMADFDALRSSQEQKLAVLDS